MLSEVTVVDIIIQHFSTINSCGFVDPPIRKHLFPLIVACREREDMLSMRSDTSYKTEIINVLRKKNNAMRPKYFIRACQSSSNTLCKYPPPLPTPSAFAQSNADTLYPLHLPITRRLQRPPQNLDAVRWNQTNRTDCRNPPGKGQTPNVCQIKVSAQKRYAADIYGYGAQ